MNRIKIISYLELFLLLLQGCSKDTPPFQEHAEPDWVLQSPELLPNSFTAIVALPEDINVYAGAGDQMAAFIGGECRGTGTLVKSGDSEKSIYYITIRASDTEKGEITFRYYNSRLSYLYQAKQKVPFEIDGNYGTYDAPVILDLAY